MIYNTCKNTSELNEGSGNIKKIFKIGRSYEI